jgi:HEPN domain-containing protein
MKIDDVKEWFEIAHEDLESAKFLTKKYPTPLEIICYHCSQSAEKYLKGYLASLDIIAPKTHNLNVLLELCLDKDEAFQKIRKECEILTRFATDIRYPNKLNIIETDAKYAIKFAEKIRDLEPIKNLREIER